MKEIYTKQISRLPDELPVRSEKGIEVDYTSDGKVSDIYEIDHYGRKKVDLDGTPLPEIPGEWLENVEDHFFSTNGETIGYHLTGIFKINSDFINPLIPYLDSINFPQYCQIKNNIKNEMPEEFMQNFGKYYYDNIIIGNHDQNFANFFIKNCTEYFNGLGYNTNIDSGHHTSMGTCINQIEAIIPLNEVLQQNPKFLQTYYAHLILGVSQHYVLAEKDNEYYLFQFVLFD